MDNWYEVWRNETVFCNDTPYFWDDGVYYASAYRYNTYTDAQLAIDSVRRYPNLSRINPDDLFIKQFEIREVK